MATLHIVNGSPASGALARCLYAASAGDTVLLIGSGIYSADAIAFERVRSKGHSLAWCVLADDVRSRSQMDRLAAGIALIEDDGFVDLVVAHQPIVSWSA